MTALDRAGRLAEEYGMLRPGQDLLAAVSGGADSMCLLHWLCRKGEELGFAVTAAHYDHRLRGEESDRDREFVRAWCAQNGIPLILGEGDVAAEARRLGRGIEETARRMRYAFLADAARRAGAPLIATAHNAGDNAETVLMHLIRGTGLRGLGGIPPRQDPLIRPLLTTPRCDIEAYLDAFSIPHVEDSTNRDDDLLRNRVRHRLIPLLEEWNPGFSRRMSEAVPALRADNDCLEAQALAIAGQARRQGDWLVLDAAVLAGAPDPIALRAARLLFLAAAGDGADGPSAPHLRAVTSLARSDDPSGQVSLPLGLTAFRRYGELVLTAAPPSSPPVPFAPLRGDNPVPGTGWTAVLDGEPWPGLVLRPRQAGDTVTLPGRPPKRLKELFIDEKVPLKDRGSIPVAADDQGVLAVAGFGPNTAHPRSGALRFVRNETTNTGTGERL